jgi:hypothetical protein
MFSLERRVQKGKLKSTITLNVCCPPRDGRELVPGALPGKKEFTEKTSKEYYLAYRLSEKKPYCYKRN